MCSARTSSAVLEVRSEKRDETKREREEGGREAGSNRLSNLTSPASEYAASEMVGTLQQSRTEVYWLARSFKRFPPVAAVNLLSIEGSVWP